MDPRKTAVVLIEYQNDFTSDGGSLHDAVKGVMDKEKMLPHTVETVAKADRPCTERGLYRIARLRPPASARPVVLQGRVQIFTRARRGGIDLQRLPELADRFFPRPLKP